MILLLLGCSVFWSTTIARSCQRTEVLVLGAGASGIMAADILHKEKVDFMVLEGRDHIGGRVHHVMYKGSKLEMGATWSHESHTNHSVWKLLKKYNMTVYKDESSVIYRDVETGERYVNADGVQEKLKHSVEIMDKVMEERAEQGESEISLSVGLNLGGWIAQNKLERSVEYWNFDYENGVPIGVIGSYQYGMASQKKEMIVTDKRGYNYIFKATAKPFEDKVLLKKIVNIIKKDTNGYYQVGTSDGTCFEGKQVLVTFSSNVLASGRIKFQPDLPSWKMRAQLMYPLAHYCKIVLEFNERFWDLTDYITAVQDNPDEYSLWRNLNVIGLYSEKKMLEAVLLGYKCVRSQKEDDSKVISDAMKVLRNLYGNDIPNPIGMVRSNWSMDPFTLGAFSYAAAGINDDDWKAIEHPVGDIWFAGEHTHKELFGYLHGAVDSGVLAAKKMLSCKRDRSNCPGPYKRSTTACRSATSSSNLLSASLDQTYIHAYTFAIFMMAVQL